MESNDATFVSEKENVDEQLLEWLKCNLAQMQSRNTLDRRDADRWRLFAFGLAVSLVVSIALMIGSVSFIVNSHSEQIQIISEALKMLQAGGN